MGRKSRVQERREDILAAFERCIIKYGLDVSLERVAEEAGVQRSIIRHYIGNRDVVIEEVFERVTHNYMAQTQQAVEPLRTLDQLLDYLFCSDGDYNTSEQLIVDILVSAQERFPNAKQRLRELFQSFVDLLAAKLMQVYPTAAPAQCQQVAYSVFCMSTTNDIMMWSGLPPHYTPAVRSSAAFLVGSLAGSATP